jgi:hypothetical protein
MRLRTICTVRDVPKRVFAYQNMLIKQNGLTATFARSYCRHKYVFWLGIVLLAVFIFVASAFNTQYQCWQWKTDPLGATILERLHKGLRVPRIADVSQSTTDITVK